MARYCAKCGAGVTEGSKFCKSCGTLVGDTQQIIWFVAFYLSQHGSELPGTIAYFATGFPLGAFAGGIGLRIHQQVSDKKREKG